MFKNVEKSKILLSFVAIALIFVLLGSSYSLATEDNSGNGITTITATTENETSNNTRNTNTGNNTSNTNTNKTTNITSVVGNNSVNNTANNTSNNTSVYNKTNTTTNSSNLPYTGTSSKTIALVVLFGISAVYAYKKVSDYNV